MPGTAESHSNGALPQAVGARAGATLGVAIELWPWAEQGWVAGWAHRPRGAEGNKFGVPVGTSRLSPVCPSKTGFIQPQVYFGGSGTLNFGPGNLKNYQY